MWCGMGWGEVGWCKMTGSGMGMIWDGVGWHRVVWSDLSIPKLSLML